MSFVAICISQVKYVRSLISLSFPFFHLQLERHKHSVPESSAGRGSTETDRVPRNRSSDRHQHVQYGMDGKFGADETISSYVPVSLFIVERSERTASSGKRWTL